MVDALWQVIELLPCDTRGVCGMLFMLIGVLILGYWVIKSQEESR